LCIIWIIGIIKTKLILNNFDNDILRWKYFVSLTIFRGENTLFHSFYISWKTNQWKSMDNLSPWSDFVWCMGVLFLIVLISFSRLLPKVSIIDMILIWDLFVRNRIEDIHLNVLRTIKFLKMLWKNSSSMTNWIN